MFDQLSSMVEVFKTNVKEPGHAKMVIDVIHQNFSSYKANFDLDDCDRILRVASTGTIETCALIILLKDLGFHAEVLPDEVPLTGTAYINEKITQ